jgi:hypothetical protein
MTSPEKAAANAANAQHSSGPVSGTASPRTNHSSLPNAGRNSISLKPRSKRSAPRKAASS